MSLFSYPPFSVQNIQIRRNELILLISFRFPGYTTNTLTNANVGIGKSSLDSHSHFRQSGELCDHSNIVFTIHLAEANKNRGEQKREREEKKKKKHQRIMDIT